MAATTVFSYRLAGVLCWSLLSTGLTAAATEIVPHSQVLAGVVSPVAEVTISNRMRTLADRWLALIDSRAIEASAYAPLLATDGLDLQLPEGSASNPAELSLLLQDRFRSLQSSRHRIAYIKVETQAPGRYRLRMELDWQGQGRDGLTELARLDVVWLVEQTSDGSLRISDVRERYLPPLQGTGARIKC